jgi:hypothetical protein
VQVVDGLRRHAGEAGSVALNDLAGDDGGLVGGVIEDLDLEAVAGIIQTATGVDEPVDDELLVKDGQLDGDEGKLAFGKLGGGLIPLGGVLAVAVLEPDQLIAVHAVEGEDQHDDEVGNKQADIEGVPAIEVLEGAVGVVGAPVVTEALGDEEQRKGGWIRDCRGDR